jgi:hypothetical protein
MDRYARLWIYSYYKHMFVVAIILQRSATLSHAPIPLGPGLCAGEQRQQGKEIP